MTPAASSPPNGTVRPESPSLTSSWTVDSRFSGSSICRGPAPFWGLQRRAQRAVVDLGRAPGTASGPRWLIAGRSPALFQHHFGDDRPARDLARLGRFRPRPPEANPLHCRLLLRRG